MQKETVKDNKEIKELSQEVALENIIAYAIQVPGVKVDRAKFLAHTFAKDKDLLRIIDEGPVAVGISEENIRRVAVKLILTRTSESSFASFAISAPGVLSIGVSVPADVVQFYGMLLRLAQELAYLYGAQDMWKDGVVDNSVVRGQLILYCGVMFGVMGAVEGVRVLSSKLAQTTLKKLPQKDLIKTFWYPIIKKIGSMVGVSVSKDTLAKGMAKVIPFIGGVISGAMTFASMKPMAEKLLNALEKATFHYSEQEYINDIEIVDSVDGVIDVSNVENQEPSKKKFSLEKSKEKLGALFKKKQKEDDPFEQIRRLKELLDMGAITQEEYDEKKREILNL